MGIYARIVHHAIRPEAVLAEVGLASDGALLLFLGTVRDHADGRPVAGLGYEAYEPMAREVLQEILFETVARTGVETLAAVHRVGDLQVGDVSVAVAVSSPHRAAAYEASRHVIEEVKRRLPVWKKERYADGGEAWVRGRDPVAEPPAGGTILEREGSP